LLFNCHDESSMHETGQGNCLSTQASVWVEGEPLPRQLGQIRPGDRILCYDRLGGHLKHAIVSQVDEVAGPAVWNKVVLVDGTTMELTADHPVQPVPAKVEGYGFGPWNLESRVQARDLRPGLDSLLVLKVMPILVQSVERCELATTRVALSVQQPERHAIFAASNAQMGGGGMQTMAVESTGLLHQAQVTLASRKTFLHAKTETRPTVEAQPHSAPASLGGGSQASVHSFYRSISSQSEVPPSGLSLVASSDSVSSSSLASTGNAVAQEEVHISSSYAPTISPDGVATGTQPTQNDTSVSLSGFLAVRRAGWRSLGSAGHWSSQCRPCAFENRRQHSCGNPCVKGALCEFCHEPHEYDVRQVKRQATRKSKRDQKKLAWAENASISEGPQEAA